MNSNESGDNRLDRYLDEQMSQQEIADFLKSEDSNDLEQVVELQSKIDDSLRRLLSGMEIDKKGIEEQFLRTVDGDPSKAETLKPAGLAGGQLLKLAMAAVLLVAVGLGVWFNTGPRSVEPVVTARPLTEIYAEKLAAGFTPYYYCEDEQRFAGTFEVKLGQALALGAMPSDRRMIGLSYLGGISGETVAMLSEVQGKEVIVFVDRDNAPGIETAIESSSTDLNVFVERKNGLVFVEVTPLDSAALIEYFESAK